MSGPGSPRNGSPELTIEPGATIVELRERIDAVDAEIVRLLSARSRYGYAIASIRKAGDAGALLGALSRGALFFAPVDRALFFDAGIGRSPFGPVRVRSSVKVSSDGVASL